MHFWIDKRSQACGYNGRHRIPASLSSGRRRRSKPIVTPVHRLQSESGTGQHVRRPHQHVSHSRNNTNHTCLTPVITNGAVPTPVTRPPHSAELDSGVYLDGPIDGAIDTAQHAQLMRLGGLIKYGMWASFILTTLSVAATKYYVDHQGTFEILLLCTLGVLSLGLLVSCILSVCRTKTAQHYMNAQATTQRSGIEIEIPEPLPHREEVILTVNNSSPQNAVMVNVAPEVEQPPPPYHIAILLPPKETCPEDIPPPCYENAVR